MINFVIYLFVIYHSGMFQAAVSTEPLASSFREATVLYLHKVRCRSSRLTSVGSIMSNMESQTGRDYVGRCTARDSCYVVLLAGLHICTDQLVCSDVMIVVVVNSKTLPAGHAAAAAEDGAINDH